MEYEIIAADTVRRLTIYLHYIRKLPRGTEEITPKLLAEASCLNPSLVRQDMKALFGKDRITSESREDFLAAIARQIEPCERSSVVLIGAGKLGSALIGYAGFSVYHLDVLAGFDVDPKVIKKGAFGKPVYPMDRLSEICRKLNAKIGILTTPGNCAQTIAASLVDCGIAAIWNFSSAKLELPPAVMVRNENMSSTLQQLAAYAAAHSLGRRAGRKSR